MADSRKEYEVEINSVKHTLLLTPEDAERYDGAKERKVANKAGSASNKEA